jgi:peptidoglycan/LPS O-acetylase OafA/YrhL
MEYISSLVEWVYWTVIIAFGLGVATGFLRVIELPFRALRRSMERKANGRDRKREGRYAAWKQLGLKLGCMMRRHPC